MNKISVVIPVRNGESTLDKCLQSIRSQTLSDAIEIIVLDSMSTDRSREIALKYNARIIPVTEGSFNHGLTRNLGVEHANADLVYLTVQDAWIAETDMLERMSAHFEKIEIAAVCGHQAVPHEKDKNPFFWRRSFSEPIPNYKELNDVDTFNALDLESKKDLIAWDNVTAMYKKSALIQLPFENTEFAEDWLWCYNALLKGWRLLYDPSIVVYHYHHGTFSYTFKVNYTVNYHFYKYFAFEPTIPGVLRPIVERSYHLIRNRQLSLGEKFFWILHNAENIVATNISVINFLIRLKLGRLYSVESGFKKYCSNVPQGKQNLSI
ncbi:glycosyltransferase family 2 protein [Flavisolibacter sp. BT320]|nr:glycosyltransferase family 2 protein [Flavisolibacter longurius]